MDLNKIRFIGRHINKNGKEYFSFSGCGFEFTLKPKVKNSSFTLSLISELREHDAQYIAIYLNGKFHSKEKLVEGLNKIEVKLDSGEETLVRVVKLNEAYLSAIYLNDISLINAELGDIKPSNKKLIGFYGDSLTCGFGLEGFHDEEFKMETEDYTKTCACLSCLALNMDYSVIARSGISVGIPIYVDKLFMEIYDTVDMIDKCVPDRKDDYAVVNLGTNDAGAYSLIKDEKEQESALKTFHDKYLELVERIIKDNPGAKLVFSYRMVNMDELFVNIIKDIKDYVNKHYDNRCELLEFKLNSDGACGHPYKTAHEENSKILINLIRKMEG